MKQYLTSGEAARICGVQINTIKNWVRKGEIEAVHSPGGRWRILPASLVHFLQANKMPVPESLIDLPHKILVIDDDPAVFELVRGAMKLSLLSCEISYCEDGYSGLIKIGELKPDLLVLDIMMSGINGLEVLQRLRAKPALATEMRIIVLTGAQDSKDLMTDVENVLPDAVLFKPVSVVQLLESMQGLLASGTMMRVSHD